MSYQHRRLRPVHYRVMELVLEGKSRKETASLTGLTPRSITNITNSRVFREELERRRDERDRERDRAVATAVADAKRAMDKAALAAAETQVKLLNSPDVRVRQKAANEILDRVGLVRRARQEGSGNQACVITEDQLELLRTAWE